MYIKIVRMRYGDSVVVTLSSSGLIILTSQRRLLATTCQPSCLRLKRQIKQRVATEDMRKKIRGKGVPRSLSHSSIMLTTPTMDGVSSNPSNTHGPSNDPYILFYIQAFPYDSVFPSKDNAAVNSPITFSSSLFSQPVCGLDGFC